MANGNDETNASGDALWLDYNNDGRLDLYVAQIRSDEVWFAEWPTVYRYMINVWRQGVWWTDMPLFFEIFKQSKLKFVQVFQDIASENTLLRNKGDGTFEDVTAQAGLAGLDGVSVALFADYDNDGYKDLFVRRSFKPNQLFHNNRDGTFKEIGRATNTDLLLNSRRTAVADFWNRGVLDIAVAASAGRHAL